MESRSKIELIDKLVEGYSSQSKTVNKIWLTLALICIVAIISFPKDRVVNAVENVPSNHGSACCSGNIPKNEADSIEIIGLSIERDDYYALATILIVVFLIGFASANSQSIRTRRLITRVINSMDEKEKNEIIHIRDYIDASISSSINRVAPIAQILQGKKPFLPESKSIRRPLKWIHLVYYLLLKLFSMFVLYGLPAYGLWIAFKGSYDDNGHLQTFGIPINLYYFFIPLAALLIFQLFIVDIVFTCRAASNILEKENPEALNPAQNEKQNSGEQQENG